jgi:hypothetical protein
LDWIYQRLVTTRQLRRARLGVASVAFRFAKPLIVVTSRNGSSAVLFGFMTEFGQPGKRQFLGLAMPPRHL